MSHDEFMIGENNEVENKKYKKYKKREEEERGRRG